MPSLSQKLKNLPSKPGIYLFKGAAGEILYVGKAKNLKKRVSNYFHPVRNKISNGVQNAKTEIMVSQIADLEYVIVSSELEALMLESNFIKKHLPRFNVILKDDKNYQFIKVDYETQIPQVYAVRKIDKRAPNKYFGPYTSALAVKSTLKLLKRIFRLCSNKKVGTRPCFQYHLGRCPGVCLGLMTPEAYRRSFKLIEQFLKNRQSEIVKMLRAEMAAAANARRFERAAAVRDIIGGLRRIWERQKIISPQKLSEDYLGVYQTGRLAIVKLFQVREGRLTGQENFELKTSGNEDLEEVIKSFMEQYYLEATDRPKKIISRRQPPQRGKKLGLLRLAEENAREYFEKNHETPERLLGGLQAALSLPMLPRRIECYDISNLQGTNPVGSMVVFENALPAKSDYRKFKINTKDTPDDFAMMKEILSRRFLPLVRRRLREGYSPDSQITSPTPPHEEGKDSFLKTPSLIIIDGGRGQLNVALKVLQATSYKLPAIGLAKRLEEIYLPNISHPIVLRTDSPVLQLLQRIRDEAHRFAITFHSKRRGRAAVRSRLDDIPGVGPATKKLLLKNFSSVSEIRRASLEKIAEIVGQKKAAVLKQQL